MPKAPLIRLSLALLVGMSLLAAAPVPGRDAVSATVICKDGSSSKGRQGACSHHGGINKGAAASASATDTSTPAAAAKAAPTAAATGAGAKNSGAPTAKCKDGTMSYSKHHSGTCSHHGGVAQFLDK